MSGMHQTRNSWNFANAISRRKNRDFKNKALLATLYADYKTGPDSTLNFDEYVSQNFPNEKSSKSNTPSLLSLIGGGIGGIGSLIGKGVDTVKDGVKNIVQTDPYDDEWFEHDVYGPDYQDPTREEWREARNKAYTDHLNQNLFDAAENESIMNNLPFRRPDNEIKLKKVDTPLNEIHVNYPSDTSNNAGDLSDRLADQYNAEPSVSFLSRILNGQGFQGEGGGSGQGPLYKTPDSRYKKNLGNMMDNGNNTIDWSGYTRKREDINPYKTGFGDGGNVGVDNNMIGNRKGRSGRKKNDEEENMFDMNKFRSGYMNGGTIPGYGMSGEDYIRIGQQVRDDANAVGFGYDAGQSIAQDVKRALAGGRSYGEFERKSQGKEPIYRDNIHDILAKIEALQGSRDGKYIDGGKLPGNKNGDRGNYQLEDGEFVMNKNAVKGVENTFGKGFLKYLNDMFPRKGYQQGGYLTGAGYNATRGKKQDELVDLIRKQMTSIDSTASAQIPKYRQYVDRKQITDAYNEEFGSDTWKAKLLNPLRYYKNQAGKATGMWDEKPLYRDIESPEIPYFPDINTFIDNPTSEAYEYYGQVAAPFQEQGLGAIEDILRGNRYSITNEQLKERFNRMDQLRQNLGIYE